jgi:NAD(P)-dependent dehydrogenase (short-subunit alcohol dehydrogenase family)
MVTSKVIVVTGASRGIGLAISRYLISQNCHKIVLVARSADPLQALQKQAPESVEVVTADMSKPGTGKTVIDTAIQRFGRIDGLVINHGALDPVKKIADSTAEEWNRIFNINFFSAIDLVCPLGITRQCNYNIARS